jgi:hypothetical protein
VRSSIVVYHPSIFLGNNRNFFVFFIVFSSSFVASGDGGGDRASSETARRVGVGVVSKTSIYGPYIGLPADNNTMQTQNTTKHTRARRVPRFNSISSLVFFVERL